MQDTNERRSLPTPVSGWKAACCGPTDSQGRAALLRPAVGARAACGGGVAGIGWIGRILWKRRRWCQTGFLFSNPPPPSSSLAPLPKTLVGTSSLALHSPDDDDAAADLARRLPHSDVEVN